MEEVKWESNGQLSTHSPSTYKIPAVSDMPEKFNVEIYKRGKNVEEVVNKSKTTGAAGPGAGSGALKFYSFFSYPSYTGGHLVGVPSA